MGFIICSLIFYFIFTDRYRYDAFVSCDSKDDVMCLKKGLIKHLETPETGLKFSVAYREFIAGVPIMGKTKIS